MRRYFAVSAIVIFLALTITMPAAAFEHEATYRWEGTITFSQQAGHFCNTGAEMQQRISGQGSMVKAKSVYMEEGYIAVDDTNSWVTAPGAIRNLTVTSAIKLCAPPKYSLFGWPPYGFIPDDSIITQPNGFNAVQLINGNPNGLLLPIIAAEPLTKQIWAVQVAADPGYSGQIDMAFEAAHSNNWVSGKDDPGAYDGFWFEGNIYESWPGYTEQKQGPWFPGSYFNIEQFSRTSQGTHRRYIDISSPWSHGYLNEEMTVVGMSEVWEAFSMDNLTAGDEVGALWWDLF